MKKIELMKLSIKYEHPYYSFIELSDKFGVDLSCDNNMFLKFAVIYNNNEVLKYLIDNGIDVTIENNFAVKLQSGGLNVNRQIIDLLINNGADITVDNYFPYRYAAWENNVEALKILFSYDPNVDATMLLASIEPSEIGKPMLEFLISLNANININNGAILRNNVQCYPIVKSVLKAGANVSYLSTENLQQIIQTHNKKIIDIYIKFGVDFSKINGSSIEKETQEYVDTLINWGVDPKVLAYVFSNTLIEIANKN